MSLNRNTWRSKFAVTLFSVASLVFVTSLLAFSIAISTPTSANSRIKVELDNGIALRILDKTGTTEISDLAISLEATPTGAFAARNLNVEVSSSNPSGYRLFMSTDYQNGTDNTNALVNTEDGSYTIPTLDADVTKADFSAGNNQYVNHWGYSTDDTTYKPLPTYHTNALVKKTDTEANAEKVPVYFGANADMSIHSGSYRNQVVFSAIANPIPTEYALYFDAGTSDAVSGLPETMTSSEQSAQHTFTIPSTEPSRVGYIFTGYLDEDTGTEYQAGDTITVVGNEEYVGSATLIAQWEKVGRIRYYSNEPSGTVSGTMADQTIVYMTSTTVANKVDETPLSSSTTELTLYSPNWTLSGYGFKGWNTAADGSGTMFGPNETINLATDYPDLQTQLGTGGIKLYAQWVASAGDMASWSGCSSLTQGSVTALTYGSDTYAVAKLADGKCWMIENYRLDSTAAGTKTTSMSTSSYNSREYNVTNVSGTAGAYPINLTSPAAASSTSNQYSWKSYGGYYSWASAINTEDTSSNQYYNWNGSSFSNATTATAQGICPAGWRLPRSYAGSATNNAESDFRYLNNQLNGSYSSVSTAAASNNWRTYPNNFVFAGFWGGASSYYRGTVGYYWSSTVGTSNYAYFLLFNSTAVNPARNRDKYGGVSVRCMIGS